MVIINGKVYEGDVVVVNGRVIKGKSSNKKCKQFDEKKKVSAEGIEWIDIDCDIATVNVSACDSNEISVHLLGSAITDDDVELYVERKNRKIEISAKNRGDFGLNNTSIISSSSSVMISQGGFVSGEFVLNVQIPFKVIEHIYIQSKNDNVQINSTVKANTIDVYGKNGNIKVYATFKSLDIDCKNGNIDVNAAAREDVEMHVCSRNGNINVKLSDIGVSQVHVNSKNGNCTEKTGLKGKYTAVGTIMSYNGNVKFRT